MTTALTILTIIAALSLFLAVVAIRVAKQSHDKLESWEQCLEMRSENTRQQFNKVFDHLTGLEKGVIAAGAGVSNVREALDAGFELRANINEDLRRNNAMLHKLAAKSGFYWEHDDGRWSDSTMAANQIGAQCASSGVAGAGLIQKAVARGRNRATRRS
jgi:hypothetical protein